MARKPRLNLPGGLYHVMLRGNDGQAIFTDDEDRRQFESLLAEGVLRFGHRIHHIAGWATIFIWRCSWARLHYR